MEETIPDIPTKTIEFLLIPQFSMMSVASAVEPLRSANRHLGRRAYQWRMISSDGEPVEASNGMTVAAEGGLKSSEAADFLFVCASLMTEPKQKALVHSVLHRRNREGTKLGALSSGTLILAEAGLLENKRCTIHWEYKPAFQQRFPFIECTDALYEIDGDRYTGAGGIASLDLFLFLIAQDYGIDTARAVGNQFQIDRIRAGAISQRPGSMIYLESLPLALRSAIEMMGQTLEEPKSCKAIAREVGTSVRNLERVFLRYVDMTPSRYYKMMRLDRARELLMHTNLPVVDIAVMTGFSSSSYFATCYSEHFGKNPSRDRDRGAIR